MESLDSLSLMEDQLLNFRHECFTDLPDASVKYKKSEIENVATEKTLSAKGTTYYNNKIPFYYDYADKDNTLTPSTATADNTHGILRTKFLVFLKNMLKIHI